MSADLLTYEMVAEEFGLSVRTIRRLVARKKLRAVRLSHSTVRFRRAHVDADMQKLTTRTV